MSSLSRRPVEDSSTWDQSVSDIDRVSANPSLAPGVGPGQDIEDGTTDDDLLVEQMIFDATPMEIDHFTPSTGLGAFAASYDPVDGVLDITLRVAIEYVRSSAAPWYQELADELGMSEMLGYDSGWTDEKKAIYTDKFVQQIEQTWSGKHGFQCVRPGWEQYFADVRVNVEIVDDPKVAHTVLTLHNETGPDGADLSERQRPQAPTGHATASTLDLARPSTTYSDSMHIEQQGRINEVAENAQVPYAMGADGHLTRSPQGEATLSRVSNALVDIGPDDCNPAVTATGWWSGSDQSSEKDAANLATQDTVDRLKECRSVARLDANALGDSPREVVVLHVDWSRVGGGRLDDRESHSLHQPTMAHEAGHMMGFIDEYTTNHPDYNAYNEKLRLKLSEEAWEMGAQPTRAPSDNGTIMSLGSYVAPFDYVIFYEALTALTAGTMAPGDWQIMAGALTPPVPDGGARGE